MIPGFANANASANFSFLLYQNGVTDFYREYLYNLEISNLPSGVLTDPDFASLLPPDPLTRVVNTVNLINISVPFPAKKSNFKKMKWHGRTFFAPTDNENVREGDLTFFSDTRGTVLQLFTAIWRRSSSDHSNSARVYAGGSGFSFTVTQKNTIDDYAASPFLAGVYQEKAETDSSLKDKNSPLTPPPPVSSAIIARFYNVYISGVRQEPWKRDGSELSKVTVSINWEDATFGISEGGDLYYIPEKAVKTVEPEKVIDGPYVEGAGEALE